MLTLLFKEWLSSPVGTKFSKRIEDLSKEELNECLKEAQNSNISVRSLGSNGPFSAGNHAITRGFMR